MSLKLNRTGMLSGRRRIGRTVRSLIREQVMENRLKPTTRTFAPLGTAQPTALDITMMRRAIELAQKAAAVGEVPIGALVHRDGEIIAESHNLVEAVHDPTGHAEIRVIRLAAERLGERRLNECTLVVTLEPCSMCAGAIVLGRLGRLVFGAADPKAGAVESVFRICSSPRLNHRPTICRGVLAAECGNLLTEFFRKRREIARTRRAAGEPRPSARKRLAERRRKAS